MSSDAKCPVTGAGSGLTNRDWWPDQVDLAPLRQNPPSADPMDEGFDYAAEFASLDLGAGPRHLAQELQRRRQARLVGEAADVDRARHRVPTDPVDQELEDRLQGDAVQRVVGLLVHDGRGW